MHITDAIIHFSMPGRKKKKKLSIYKIKADRKQPHAKEPATSRCSYWPEMAVSTPIKPRQCTARGCYQEYPRDEALKCQRCFRRHYCSKECRSREVDTHRCSKRREGKECCVVGCSKEGDARYNTKVCTHCWHYRYCSRKCQMEGWWCLGTPPRAKPTSSK